MLRRAFKVELELELKLEVRFADCKNEDELRWADTEELRASLNSSGEGPSIVSLPGSIQVTSPDGVLQQAHSPVVAL